MKSYRASSAPIAMRCAASVHPPEGELRVDAFNPMGQVGNALHALAAEWLVEGGEMRVGNFASRFGVDRSELGFLGFGVRAFMDEPELGGFFNGEKHVEESFEIDFTDPEFRMTGHPDLFVICEDDVRSGEVRIVDWKTTRLKAIEYGPQMLAYALLIMTKYPELNECVFWIAYLRDLESDPPKRVTRKDVEAFKQEFIERVVMWDGGIDSGLHCGFCPRRVHCPGASKQIVVSYNAIMKQQEAGLPSGPKIVEFYENAIFLERVLKGAKEQVRVAVQGAGGRIEGDDGRDLAFVPGAEKIVAELAWPRMREDFTAEQLVAGEVVSLSKTAYLKLVAEAADRGGKGAAKGAAVEALRAGGALKRGADMLKVVKSVKREES